MSYLVHFTENGEKASRKFTERADAEGFLYEFADECRAAGREPPSTLKLEQLGDHCEECGAGRDKITDNGERQLGGRAYCCEACGNQWDALPL